MYYIYIATFIETLPAEKTHIYIGLNGSDLHDKKEINITKYWIYPQTSLCWSRLDEIRERYRQVSVLLPFLFLVIVFQVPFCVITDFGNFSVFDRFHWASWRVIVK